MINRILHSCTCIAEFINSLEEIDKMFGKASRLIFSLNSFYKFKIHYKHSPATDFDREIVRWSYDVSAIACDCPARQFIKWSHCHLRRMYNFLVSSTAASGV